MKVAVLMPTRGRAEQMAENVLNLMAQDYPAGIQLLIILAVPEGDQATHNAAAMLATNSFGDRVSVIYKGRPADSTAVDGWNLSYTLAHAMSADWFILGADDIRFKPGWLSQALRVAEDTGAEVVGLNDGDHNDLNDFGAHYLVSRQFAEEFLGGYMVPPIYKSWWFDREVCEIARHEGLYAPAPLAVAEHRHPDWNTAPMDDTYRRGAKYHDEDRQTYERRRKNGYPLDYPSGLTSSYYSPPAAIEPVTTLAGSIPRLRGDRPKEKVKE